MRSSQGRGQDLAGGHHNPCGLTWIFTVPSYCLLVPEPALPPIPLVVVFFLLSMFLESKCLPKEINFFFLFFLFNYYVCCWGVCVCECVRV